MDEIAVEMLMMAELQAVLLSKTKWDKQISIMTGKRKELCL